MMKARSRYYQHIHDILNNIVDSQEAAIQKAALEMTQCIEKGHTIYAFGASHNNQPVKPLPLLELNQRLKQLKQLQ